LVKSEQWLPTVTYPNAPRGWAQGAGDLQGMLLLPGEEPSTEPWHSRACSVPMPIGHGCFWLFLTNNKNTVIKMKSPKRLCQAFLKLVIPC